LQRRIGVIGFEVIACTLVARIVIRTSDRQALQALQFLECRPDVTLSSASELVFEVEPFRGRYRISAEGEPDIELYGLRSVVDHLHAKILSLSFRAKPAAGVLHAAALRHGQHRVLLIGRKAAGKTTLALRLVQAGYEFEGDEHVFIEPDGITARPRACRVKSTSVDFLPGAAAAIFASPFYRDEWGRQTFNVDPRVLGGTWRIEKGHADCAVMLAPNHGGYSSIRPLAPLSLSQALMFEFTPPQTGRSAAVGALAKFVSVGRGFDLSLGDLAGAVRCIDRALCT
jgi:hypothetical protein